MTRYRIQLFILLIIFSFTNLNSQIVGGNGGSQLIPQEVKASDISKGAYQGNVNLFDGTYSASYPLGSVSTSQGTSFQVIMNYSPSYTTGSTPAPIDGIPYGLGWDVSLPTISVSSDTYHEFPLINHCGSSFSAMNQLWDTDPDPAMSEAVKEGTPYWFAPVVSIPGVGSGRAVFKYVDETTDRAVFTLHGFETYMDIYWNNGKWRVELEDGTYYQFDIVKATIRQAPNERTFTPDEIWNFALNSYDNEDLVLQQFRDGLMSMVMPNYEYTQWHCSEMGNLNYPTESIHFEYNRYGEFDYFAQFRHGVNKLSAEDFFTPHDGDTIDIGGACGQFVLGRVALDIAPTYNDLHLKRVYSVNGTVREELLMNYGTEMDFSGHLLDFRDSEVNRKDSLYSFKTVYSQGTSNDFVGWNRYYHWKSDGLAMNETFNSLEDDWLTPYTSPAPIPFYSGILTDAKNPYVGTIPTNLFVGGINNSVFNNMIAGIQHGGNLTDRFYARSPATDVDNPLDWLSFDHCFLESPRINSHSLSDPEGELYVPGSQYELRAMYGGSNGFVDVNIVTGSKKNGYQGEFDIPGDSDYKHFVSDIGTSNSPSAYRASRGETVYSTFGQPIKWNVNLTTEPTSELYSSNIFTLPYLPENPYDSDGSSPGFYDGFHIQIGPSNSDIHYSTLPEGVKVYNSDTDVWGPSSVRAYSFMKDYGHPCETSIINTGMLYDCGDPINQNFGIGLPWGQLFPMYRPWYYGFDHAVDASSITTIGDGAGLNFWFNDASSDDLTYENAPTALGANEKLNSIDLIRYAKNPYMLQSVSKRVMNGEHIQDVSIDQAMVLTNQIDFDYTHDQKNVVNNWDYDNPNSLEGALAYSPSSFDGGFTEYVTIDEAGHVLQYDEDDSFYFYLDENGNMIEVPVTNTSLVLSTRRIFIDSEGHLILFGEEDLESEPDASGETEWYSAQYAYYLDDSTEEVQVPFENIFWIYDELSDFPQVDVSNFKQEYFMLSTAKRVPIDRVTNAPEVLSSNDYTTLPETKWNYEFNTTINSGVYDRIFGSICTQDGEVGGVLLNSIVDELGGETEIEYHPYGYSTDSMTFGELSEAAKGSVTLAMQLTEDSNEYPPDGTLIYFLDKSYLGLVHIKGLTPTIRACGNVTINSAKTRVDDVTYSITPVVKGIKTLSENGIRERTYAYEEKTAVNLSQSPNSDHFRDAYLKNYIKGFHRTIVTEPSIDGTVNVTTYEHVGTETEGLSSIDKELLFGKLIKVEQRSNGLLVKRNTSEYLVSRAFENGKARPYFLKNQTYSDYVSYYDGVGGWEDHGGVPDQVQGTFYEQSGFSYLKYPKFLENEFFNDYGSLTYFNSYFIRKVNETSTLFDHQAERLIPCPNPVGDIAAGDVKSPTYNSAINQNKGSLLTELDTDPHSVSTKDLLVTYSPLEDEIIYELLSINPSYAEDVLDAQEQLSSSVLIAMIREESIDSKTGHRVLLKQPIVSDGVIMEFLSFPTRYTEAYTTDLLKNLPKLSENVQQFIIDQDSGISETVKQDAIRASGVTDAILSSLLDESNNITELEIRTTILNRGQLDQLHFYQLFSRANPFSASTIIMILESIREYPDEANLAVLFQSGQYGINEIESVIKLSPLPMSDPLRLILQEQYEALPESVLGGGNGNIGSGPCDCLEYFTAETTHITDYEYYDADETGYTESPGYIKLFDLEELIDIGTYDGIYLKYEPSWQLYQTTSYSPQEPEVFEQSEYFYLYDLKNRYDRHVVEGYFYGDSRIRLEEVAQDELEYSGAFERPIGYNVYGDIGSYWYITLDPDDPRDEPSTNSEKVLTVPRYSGIVYRAQENNLRSLAFQVRNTTKKSPTEEALRSSTYYHYDTRWDLDFPSIHRTVDHTTVDFCPQEYFGDLFEDNSDDDGSDDSDHDNDWDNDVAEGASSTRAVEPLEFLEGKRVMLRSIYQQVDTLDLAYDKSISMLSTSGYNSENIMDYHFELDPHQMWYPMTAYQVRPQGPLTQQAVLDGNGNVQYYNYFYYQNPDPIVPYQVNIFADGSPTVVTWITGPGIPRGYTWLPTIAYDNLKTFECVRRNFDGLPLLIEDEKGLATSIEYGGTREKIWNVNPLGTYDGENCGNYQSLNYTYFGLPSKIVQGAGRPDRRITQISYNEDYTVSSVVSGNGAVASYTYDEFGRLASNSLNGELLALNTYHQWDRNPSASFFDRAGQNYVSSELLNDNLPSLASRSYVDPLGRSYARTSGLMGNDGFGNGDVMIASGQVIYDNWDRAIKSFKSTEVSLNTHQLNPIFDSSAPYVESIQENDFYSRPLKSSDYGIDIDSDHTNRMEYKTIDIEMFSCQADLSASERGRLFGAGDDEIVIHQTTSIDQDGNENVEYTSPSGQLIAQRAEIDESTYAVTLFIYDSYGNLTTVINPLKQESHYRYNILGWMYEKETPDGGLSKYMYNKSGQVVLEQHANDAVNHDLDIYSPDDGELVTQHVKRYTAYDYDHYGNRIKEMLIGTAPDPLLYETTFNDVLYSEGDEGELVLDLDQLQMFGGLSCNEYVEQEVAAQLPIYYYFSNRSTMDWLATMAILYHQVHYAIDVVQSDWGTGGSGAGWSAEDWTGNWEEEIDTSNDFDLDGVPDQLDNCPCVANNTQENSDGTWPYDIDLDGDGVIDITTGDITVGLLTGDVLGDACDGNSYINSEIPYEDMLLLFDTDLSVVSDCIGDGNTGGGVVDDTGSSSNDPIIDIRTNLTSGSNTYPDVREGEGGLTQDFLKDYTYGDIIIIRPGPGDGIVSVGNPLSYINCLTVFGDGGNIGGSIGQSFSLEPTLVRDFFSGTTPRSEEVIKEWTYGGGV